MELAYRNYRQEPQAWASALGVSRAAVDLYLESEVIDLHTCSFMWSRIFPGYDLRARHRPFLPDSFAFNQVDLPRTREAQMAGMCWDIPTNPLRRDGKRATTTLRNVASVAETIRQFPSEFELCSSASDYDRARASGRTAALIALQGGQGLEDDLDSFDRIPDDLVHRITVVHLTRSKLGAPNSLPRLADRGLSVLGHEFVRRMQEKRILVDLAHINRRGFFDVLRATDPSIPVAVTHTGVSAVRPLWRNIDDPQIRAIADRAGTIGIIYQPVFLAAARRCPVESIIEHMQHVIDIVGDDHVSLGSDYDGLISLPQGFVDITHQPKLVEEMLVRRWSADRIKKILGGNFLRVLQAVRP